jgi:uncharacterized protein (TIRG00374 family)
MADKMSGKWKRIITGVTIFALVFLVFATRQQIVDTFSHLGEVRASVLLFMIVFQIWNYHAYTRLYQDLFKIIQAKIDYKSMYKIAVELNFVNHIFPSAGLSGFSYFSLRLKSHGISAARATLVQIMRFGTVFISFQLLLFGGLFLLAINGNDNILTILVASSIGTLLVVGTGLTLYIIGSKQRIDSFFTFLTKLLNRLIQFIRPKYPETINIARARQAFVELHENYKLISKNYSKLKKPLVYAFIANFTEVATIYTVYIAFGEAVNPGAVIIAYAVANFAGLISVLPGGIGIYEGLMVAVLAGAGVSPALSIPVTVMYRVLSMLIQLPPGYYLYQKAIASSGKPS